MSYFFYINFYVRIFFLCDESYEFWKHNHRGRVPFSSTVSRVHTINMPSVIRHITDDVDLHHLVLVDFAMFLHWKVKSFCPLEKNHSSQPTGIGWELCSTSLRGGDYLYNFFGILCMGDLSLIPTLSISINIDSWRLIIL